MPAKKFKQMHIANSEAAFYHISIFSYMIARMIHYACVCDLIFMNCGSLRYRAEQY